MTLPAPKLDSRTFVQLMAEARARIPRFTPEWTNFNDADPGMALVQLQAWLTETILYELNRVPDLNYVKFLDLIGITPRPARAARTELSFMLDKLDKPDDPLSVPVPLATRVIVDDPDNIKTEIGFETDRSLLALNADFGMVVVPSVVDNLTRALVTQYEEGSGWPHFFNPFGPVPQTGSCVYIGLVLRPKLAQDLARYVADSLPAGQLDLFADLAEVHDAEPGGPEIDTPPEHACENGGAMPADLAWEVYVGLAEPADWNDGVTAGWQPLVASSDTSCGLGYSGHVVLELPARATAVNPRALPRAFWESFGQLKPPASFDDLVNTLADLEDVAALDGYWEKMGIGDGATLTALAACGSSAAAVEQQLNRLPQAGRPDPSKLTVEDWIAVDPGFASAGLPVVEGQYRRLYWIRARLISPASPGAKGPGLMRRFRLNTVSATQGTTRQEDRLGLSNGRPGQTFTLPRTPVLIDPASGQPDLALSVGGETDWRRVDDFYKEDDLRKSNPESKIYLLDPGTGRITFGDGLRGQIPVAGAAVVVVRSRIGGGRIGNVGPGAITKLKGRVRGVKAVTNPRAAHDGADAETLDEVKLRAPHDLRNQDRAVSASDFVDLAMATPGALLHKVVALPRMALAGDQRLEPRDGSVTLVLLPVSDHPKPLPTEAQLQAVCRHLEPRRLVTTELHLTGPRYVEVTEIALTVKIADGYDLALVSNAVYEAILGFLHPITGGRDGSGWPFGEDIHHADIYDRVLAVPGVRRAYGLQVSTEEEPGGNALTDVTPLAQGALPSLTRDRIKAVVGYV